MCKGSANRMKNQINLSFSEVQPTFDEIKGTKKSQSFIVLLWDLNFIGNSRYYNAIGTTTLNVMLRPML